jgi:hypothetical protein
VAVNPPTFLLTWRRRLDLAEATLDDIGLDVDVAPEEVVDETPEEGQDTDLAPEGDETADPKEPKPEGEAHDGRAVPAKVRSALKAFRDGNPEHAEAAKLLQDSYGRAEAYKQVFPKVEDARAAHTLIESIGGPAGVADVQRQLQDVDEIDALLAEGNIEVLDRIAPIAGEGLNKLAPEILNRMQKTNPEVWASTIKPHLAAALDQVGMPAAIQSLWQAFQNSRRADAPDSFKKEAAEQAEGIMQGIHRWLRDQGKVDPAAAKPDQKITQREQALQQREQEAFRGDVGAKANVGINASLKKELTPYLAKLSLSDESRADLVQGIWDEAGKFVKADKVYQGQKDAAFKAKNRDAGKIASLMQAKFDSVVAQAVKTVVNRRYPAGVKPGVAKPGVVQPGVTKPGVQAAGAPIKIAAKPDRSQINWAKTTQDDTLRSRAWTVSGKYVTWRQ